MREILFRAKAINRIEGREYRTKYKNGDWVFGLLSKPYHDFNGYIQPAEMRNTDGVDGIDVDHETLGQYTGLTDKNGVKIFEGDIIQDQETFERGIVMFGEYNDFTGTSHVGFYVRWNRVHLRPDILFWIRYRKIEVTGNIYDNPELVEGDTNAERPL